MRKNLITLCLILLSVLASYAQTGTNGSFSIKGQVVDSLTNESVPYATLSIALASAPQQPIKLLACDDDGRFESSMSQAGQYLIRTQSIGKVSSARQFDLTEGQPKLDLGLLYMTDDTQKLDEVTVTAQKPLVKVEIDKITYNLSDDPEAATNNTLEMLRKVPMVTVDGEDKIQLKGSSNYKIYLNGKPSNMLSGETASDVLKSMPANSVKNIEVITDPGAKYDAEGVGGIINIITTKNALQGYQANLRADVSSLGRYSGGGFLTTKIGKLGLTANYNYMHMDGPWNDYETERTSTMGDVTQHLSQVGKSKNKGPRQYGSLEASYEIDTLNLISIGGNIFQGNYKGLSRNRSEMTQNIMPSALLEELYSYDQEGYSKVVFGGMDANIDYQRSTHKKDELITVSYRFSYNPNDSENRTVLSNLLNLPDYLSENRWNINDAFTREHTAQIDYTTPTFKDQSLEAGVKYILRQSSSETEERIQDPNGGDWEIRKNNDRDMMHSQHIYSAYFAYAYKKDKFGAKAGVRAEGTALDVEFMNNHNMDFDNHYFDVVPNATISYQLSMASQLRLGYNMRIYRPGIWYLNPYVNDTDPQNISYGNPNLDSEKSHSVNLNYSMFTQKFNMNASVNYNFVNNSIERFSWVNEDGANESTYYNMGKNRSFGVFLWGRWNPVPLFSVSLNQGVNWNEIDGGEGRYNSGWSSQTFMNMQFRLPKDFSIDLHGGYMTPYLQLQTKGSAYYFNGMNINKSFIDKKLTVSLGVQSPFEKHMKFKNTTTGENFRQVSTNWMNSREVRIRVSYRFGSMKDTIKKVRRGISNDDMKGGGESGGGGEVSM